MFSQRQQTSSFVGTNFSDAFFLVFFEFEEVSLRFGQASDEISFRKLGIICVTYSGLQTVCVYLIRGASAIDPAEIVAGPCLLSVCYFFFLLPVALSSQPLIAARPCSMIMSFRFDRVVEMSMMVKSAAEPQLSDERSSVKNAV